MLNAGTTTALNTGLTAAEVLTAAEPAPVRYGTKAERRRRDILGVTWILAAIASGVLYGVYRDAAFPGEADWALMVLAVTVPFVVVFTFYPRWQDRRHKKRHKAWLSRFIALWPLRGRLVEVERTRDLRQRIIVEDLAAAMAQGRETLLRQSGAPTHADCALLMQALTAVGASRAVRPTDCPTLWSAERASAAAAAQQRISQRRRPVAGVGLVQRGAARVDEQVELQLPAHQNADPIEASSGAVAPAKRLSGRSRP